jgi:hypothetical protein
LNFNANPEPAFYFNADPDPAPKQSDTNLRPLVFIPSKAPFEPPSLHCERPRPSTAPFCDSKARQFRNADPDPAVLSNADPDPISKINADPYGSESATLLIFLLTRQRM